MKLLERTLGWLAAVVLFSMMVLTFVDVIGRKFFDASIAGSLEITELLMLLLIFAGLPLASLKGEHVIFDLLDRFVPRGLTRLQHSLSHLLSASLLAGAAWLTFSRAARTLEQGDQTAQLAIGIAPFQYTAAALIAATALMHVGLALTTPRVEHDEAPASGAI